MNDEKKKEIFNKIEDLKKLAEETKSPLLLMFKEADEQNGRHVAAYGSGPDIKKLIVDAAQHNESLMKVMRVALKDINSPDTDPHDLCGHKNEEICNTCPVLNKSVLTTKDLKDDDQAREERRFDNPVY